MGMVNATFSASPEPTIQAVFATVDELFDAQITLSEAIINLSQMSASVANTPFYQPVENIINSLLAIFEDHLTFEEAEIAIQQELELIEQI